MHKQQKLVKSTKKIGEETNEGHRGDKLSFTLKYFTASFPDSRSILAGECESGGGSAAVRGTEESLHIAVSHKQAPQFPKRGSGFSFCRV